MSTDTWTDPPTADDWYFDGREPTEEECGGWPDPTLWEGFVMEAPDEADPSLNLHPRHA